MVNELTAAAYDNLLLSLRDEEGVKVTSEGLLVHGKLFAFVEGDDLVVELSEARTADLTTRGVAAPFLDGEKSERNWVRVSDLQLWPELAEEAHDFVGEPPVGGES
ncbi:hypothetical protein [Herbiconiux daphne]|uniref:TfoX N-terminal domain-containing protein n=1 Tax=Herbiconiux daphne TaxID=2970914 RepID=A0ABT2H4N7_9MICO|nr:hypothetical protein [Herbiconiux daphne]MCS5734905.1 hypothetical protein [Herbiconiux daphne]